MKKEFEIASFDIVKKQVIWNRGMKDVFGGLSIAGGQGVLIEGRTIILIDLGTGRT